MDSGVTMSPSSTVTTSTAVVPRSDTSPPPVRRTPDHPPYAEMIQAAIRTLAEDGGSTATAIDDYIKANYDDLPWGHRNLFPHYLRKLIAAGEIIHSPTGRFLLYDDEPISIPTPPHHSHTKPRRPISSCGSPMLRAGDGHDAEGSGSTPGSRRGRSVGFVASSRRGRACCAAEDVWLVAVEGEVGSSMTGRRRRRRKHVEGDATQDSSSREVVASEVPLEFATPMSALRREVDDGVEPCADQGGRGDAMPDPACLVAREVVPGRRKRGRPRKIGPGPGNVGAQVIGVDENEDAGVPCRGRGRGRGRGRSRGRGRGESRLSNVLGHRGMGLHRRRGRGRHAKVSESRGIAVGLVNRDGPFELPEVTPELPMLDAEVAAVNTQDNVGNVPFQVESEVAVNCVIGSEKQEDRSIPSDFIPNIMGVHHSDFQLETSILESTGVADGYESMNDQSKPPGFTTLIPPELLPNTADDHGCIVQLENNISDGYEKLSDQLKPLEFTMDMLFPSELEPNVTDEHGGTLQMEMGSLESMGVGVVYEKPSDELDHLEFTMDQLMLSEFMPNTFVDRGQLETMGPSDQSRLPEFAMDSLTHSEPISNASDGHGDTLQLGTDTSESLGDALGCGNQPDQLKPLELTTDMPTCVPDVAVVTNDHSEINPLETNAAEPSDVFIDSEKHVDHHSQSEVTPEPATHKLDLTDTGNDHGGVLPLKNKAPESLGKECTGSRKRKSLWKPPEHRPEPPKLRPRAAKQ